MANFTVPNDFNLAEHFGPQFLSLVPHWFTAEHGPHRLQLVFGEQPFDFYSLTLPSKNERTLLKYMNSFIAKMKNATHVTTPAYATVMQEEMVARWLDFANKDIHWYRLIRYLTGLTHRTAENSSICLNLIISKEEESTGKGSGRIDRPSIQKVIDHLASSPFTYIKVTPLLALLEYGDISMADVSPDTSYHCPEFLRPVRSIMKGDDVLASVTSRGDIIIMTCDGLLASRRSGSWKIYDTERLTHCVVQCFGSEEVGNNVFGLMFDLSYRRHGALLVYDPDHAVLPLVVNRESVVDNAEASTPSVQFWLRPMLSNIAASQPGSFSAKRRVLSEIASVDGAVLFDDTSILAFGSIIPTHEECGHLGARTTAAKSALLFGGKPVKISSDGQIALYFTSTGDDGIENHPCDAEIEIL